MLRAICYESLLDLVRESRSKCTACGGTGRTRAIDGAGARSTRTCTRCHGTRYDYKIICR